MTWSLCSTPQPFISVSEIESFIVTWLLSKSTSDDCDKVDGSFRLCEMDEVAFPKWSMNSVVMISVFQNVIVSCD